MKLSRRREMVDRRHRSLSSVRHCALFGISLSSQHHRRKGPSSEELSSMRELDRQYLETTFYGSRRMKAWLERQGRPVKRNRSYPDLLGKTEITRPNQVWAADVT